jgi:tol-pal system protein YbgF
VLPQEAAGSVGDAASSAAVGDLTQRVGALETQIGALSSQLDQLGRQMSAIQAKLAATPSQAATPPHETPQPAQAPPIQQSEAPPPPPPAPAEQSLASTTEDTSKPRWFGDPTADTTGATANSAPQPLAPLAHGDAPPPSQGVNAGIPNSDAQSLYEQGYGSILQRDYGAAETAFRQLIAAYPNDPLAGSAQYWIGESYYVRGQYKSAADAFLKGYKKYKSGDKAPDTLLRLGMSLAELGQKDAACSTFGELAAKYPQAPVHILDQARGERKKAGC